MTKVERLSLDELQMATFSEMISTEEQMELYGGGDFWSQVANFFGAAWSVISSMFGSSNSNASIDVNKQGDNSMSVSVNGSPGAFITIPSNTNGYSWERNYINGIDSVTIWTNGKSITMPASQVRWQ